MGRQGLHTYCSGLGTAGTTDGVWVLFARNGVPVDSIGSKRRDGGCNREGLGWFSRQAQLVSGRQAGLSRIGIGHTSTLDCLQPNASWISQLGRDDFHSLEILQRIRPCHASVLHLKSRKMTKCPNATGIHRPALSPVPPSASQTPSAPIHGYRRGTARCCSTSWASFLNSFTTV
jgi:hypothetical protein